MPTLAKSLESPARSLYYATRASKVKELLPNIIASVKVAGLGNLAVRPDARKHAQDGIGNQNSPGVRRACGASLLEVHKRMGSQFTGVHLEMTGENVTECVGGRRTCSNPTCRSVTRRTVIRG